MWVNLGVLHQRNQAPSEAERCYRKALELHPEFQAAEEGLERVG